MSQTRDQALCYFAHNTLQVPRVARQCMVALCEGATELGAAGEIVSISLRPNAAESRHPDLPTLYGVQSPVTFTCYSLPFLRVGETAKTVAAFRLAAYAWHSIRPSTVRVLRLHQCAVVSGRNVSVLAMLIVLKRWHPNAVVLADVHGLPTSRIAKWVHRHVDGNVCISRHLGNSLQQQLGLTAARVRVAHTGVKPDRFLRNESKEAIAARLGLDRSRPLICYSGKVFYRYEEIAYLLEVARRSRGEFNLVIVGGRRDQIPPWEAECRREGIGNVAFTGFKLPSEIPSYLHAADLLVMYYSPSPLNDYRSPGKLFEYLASGTPLVASRFRGVEEVVTDGENGFLVEPYRPELLAGRIRELLANRRGWEAVGVRGIATAQRYTWRARAGVFLDYAREIQNGKLSAGSASGRAATA